MGSAFIMRGYYTGRYRDQNFAAGQLEYRLRFVAPDVKPTHTFESILSRLGLVFFGGTGSVFSNANFTLSNFKPNYGLGLRYFYDKPSGINIRADYGMGEKPTGEPRVGNFYLFIGEAF
jgi:hypothetical protein